MLLADDNNLEADDLTQSGHDGFSIIFVFAHLPRLTDQFIIYRYS
jgi:hypothetical protein